MPKVKKEMEEVFEKIINADFKETMEKSYIDYAIEVISERALPDIRDGLKPVQRKAIYTLEELGILKDKAYKKAGRVVGECMGKYHPHGDTSIYDTMVRMSQPFINNLPLVDGHGNWGSIDGDGAAAMRYTECRLEKIGNEMIDGLKERIVKFVPNFDEEEIEPVILPCRFPNLLINGTNGIAVGLVSIIPPHNVKDAIDTVIYYLKKTSSKNKEVTVSELLDILKGPDFPTGGTISNSEDLLDIYKTGEGKIYIRAKFVEETIAGKPCLIVTEIPYTYSGRKASLIDKLSKIILTKKIEELNEIRDESSKEGLRIVLECKKGSDLTKVANKLYRYSPLQDTMTIRFNGLIGKELKPFNLLDYCKYFSDFQEEIYIKEYENKKTRLEKKKEIYEGLVKALDYIDVIIDLIRHAESVAFAKRCLMTGNTNNIKFKVKKNETIASKFNFTEIQAESILGTTLRNLNSLEITALDNSLKETIKLIEDYTKILSNKAELHKVIINRLTKISKEYATKRKTILTSSKIIEYVEEEKEYEVNVIYDKYGYIKVFDEKTISKIDDSITENCKINLKTNNKDSLICFSNTGIVYQIKLKDLPFNKINDRGILIEGKLGKKVEGNILFVSNTNTDGKFLFITKKGLVKIVDKKEFISTRAITNSTKLSDTDEIMQIYELSGEDKILVSTDKNYLNFKISEVPEIKKNSLGVVSIKINPDEEIKNVEIYNSKDEINESKLHLKNQKRGSKGTKLG